MRGANSNTQFPIDYGTNVHNPIAHDGYVYDFVLANRSILASPLQRMHHFAPHATAPQLREDCFFAATFGHTVTLGCFAHAYFGSERAVNDLKRHAHWSSGYILLDKYTFVRAEAEDDAERKVIGMLFESESLVSTTVEQSGEDLWTATAVKVVAA